ncbi:hypothetical protein KLMIMM195B_13270 [Klebsiella michiganensis]
MQNTQPQHTPLWQRYLSTKAQSSAKYARDIAAEMGISEAELTEARLGYDAVRLQDDARAILTALETVGETKCICRNEYAVHEQVGEFTHQHLSGHAGLVLNPRALDLRLFLSQWASAFRLNDNGRQSIQFFDPHGDALLKVYTTGNTDMAAWDALIAGHTQQSPAPLAIRPAEPLKYADSADAAALENEWRAMTDVHQFFGLLRKYSLSRQQAFRLVSDDLACRIDTQTLPGLLETIRQDGNEIMIFVGNRGCVQIFTGALEKVAPMRGWLNIFNPAFTLHLREESVDEIWVTRKPTSDGHVTEVVYALDAQRQLVAKDSTSTWPAAAQSLPDVGYILQLNAEGILSLRPTLVLASAQAQPSLVLKKVEENKVKVINVPGGYDLPAIEAKIGVIADALGKQSEGNALRQKVHQQIAQIPSQPVNKRVLFILSHGGMNTMVAGKQTAADGAIRAAGLQNAMQSFDHYRSMSQEGVIASKPDLVVISADGLKGMGGEAGLWKLPGLAQTPAGRHKQVLVIDDMALLGFGPRTPQAVLALRQKAEQLP